MKEVNQIPLIKRHLKSKVTPRFRRSLYDEVLINFIASLPQVRHNLRQDVPPAPSTSTAAKRRVSSRRSSYAFSHSRGFGPLLMTRTKLARRSLKSRPALIIENRLASYSEHGRY